MPKTLPPAIALIVALAGCGGGGDNKGDGGQKKNTVIVGTNQPIAFGADEFSFEPNKVTVNSGTTGSSVVRFVIRNNGTQAHDLHVQKDGQDLGGTPVFAPGQTKAGQATVSPGTYEFICTVGDHASRGMKGTLIVTSTQTARRKDPDAGSPGEAEREREKQRQKGK